MQILTRRVAKYERMSSLNPADGEPDMSLFPARQESVTNRADSAEKSVNILMNRANPQIHSYHEEAKKKNEWIHDEENHTGHD